MRFQVRTDGLVYIKGGQTIFGSLVLKITGIDF